MKKGPSCTCSNYFSQFKYTNKNTASEKIVVLGIVFLKCKAAKYAARMSSTYYFLSQPANKPRYNRRNNIGINTAAPDVGTIFAGAVLTFHVIFIFPQRVCVKIGK